MNLRNYIYFYGLLSLDKLRPILSEMDVGVIGNRKSIATELMLPVKMLEYIALDIPVVAPRLRTIQYYFSDDMVTYYDPEDSNALAASVLALYQTREKRERQTRAARTFLDQFGWHRHQNDLLELYQRL
jgi:glycosyltransferase involved in cell wall biosynthesis